MSNDCLSQDRTERYDSTGLTRYHGYDFKGNNLSSSRYFSQDPKAELDWSVATNIPDDNQELDVVNIGNLGEDSFDDSFDDGAHTTQEDLTKALAAKELAEKSRQYLEANAYTSHYDYDALNRVIKEINPDNSIIIRRYDETTWLRRVIAKTPTNINPLRPNTSKNSSNQGNNENNENNQDVLGQTNALTKKIIVKNIHYNAKGQRTKIAYGNGSQTRYVYDENTFRLIRQQTRAKIDAQAGSISANNQNNQGKLLQDLNYTHDAVGNIVAIKDRAVPTRFFANQKIEALSRYYYDARYRLVKATGIEHRGQNTANNNINSHSQDPSSRAHGGDGFYIKRYQANDPMAWRNYTQQYQYDEVGNITQMRHIADQANWIRDYSYAEDNNRLLSTSDNTGSFRPLELQYGYDDAHGYMTQLPHLSQMDYNFKDELIATSRQQVNVDDEVDNQTQLPQEYIVYQYDASGMRTRKVCYGQNGKIKYERRYLGSTEEYYQDSGQYAGLVRHSLHINDGEQRVALYEQRNDIDDDSPEQTMRYQIANHQPSSTLELDDEANLISYEIYHPFGTTAYQANNKDIKAAAKRYRYSGKERDEETGLYYFGARYYMPWLGRWTSCDPIVFSEGQYAEAELNGYQYVDNDPVGGVDPSGENRSLADRNRFREIQGQKPLEPAKTRRDTLNEMGINPSDGFTEENVRELASYTDANDIQILSSAVSPVDEATDITGAKATNLDVGFAAAGIFLPFVSGSAVKKLLGGIADLFKKGDNPKRSANADVDSEAGFSGNGSVKNLKSGTLHEQKVAGELAEQGLDVTLRGENVAGPDALIGDGFGPAKWWEIKELTGQAERSLQRSLGKARKNFSNAEVAELGVSRADTRALIDARENSAWNNVDKVRNKLKHLEANGDLNNVAEVKVLTTNGVVNWVRK